MKRHILASLLLLCAGLCSAADDGYLRKYTEKSPLVYEDAWDLWPYTFLNENGDPDGYNIELLHLIFKRLDIPYVIKLKPTEEALRDLKNGNSDLMLGMDADFHNEYGIYGRAVIKFFTHSVVFPTSQPPGNLTFNDLEHTKVIVHGGSFSHHLMMDRGWGDNAIPYDDIPKALRKVSSEQKGLIVWNTISLKWLIRHHQMEGLGEQPIDIPAGEYKFMANDPYLLSQLDSVYGELLASGQLEAIQAKWIYPEHHETGIPTWVWYVAAILALIVLLLWMVYLLYRYREKQLHQHLKMSNDRLSLILRSSGMVIWTYDLKTQLFVLVGEEGTPETTLTLLEMRKHFTVEHFNRLLEAIDEVRSGKEGRMNLDLETDDRKSDTGFSHISISLSVLRRDKNGQPTMLFATQSDTTDERLKQQHSNNTMKRYQSVFNTAMVDMMFFNKDKQLVNLNQKACDTFHTTKDSMLSQYWSIYSFLQLDEGALHDFDYFYATQPIVIPTQDGKGTESIMYELQLVPIYDEEHQLQGIYGTGRDVTEIYNTYRQQRHDLNLLRKANLDKRKYADNINYAMKAGGIRISIYTPATHLLSIYSQMDVVQHTLTQTRCLSLTEEEFRQDVIRMFNYMDSLTKRNIDIQVRTLIPYQHRRLFLYLHFVPITYQQGQVTSYLGMCRDVSELKFTEQLLAQETEFAQRTESDKDDFMRNMSYEIRTPLTNVVGFAELFQKEHTPQDETIFIEEIKQNSSRLLNLINDILFLSRLDAHMIEITPRQVNFAKIFDDCCNDGWADKQEEGVKYLIENPYEKLMIEIDDNNLRHVIHQVISNAVQNTTSGTVRARYDYINDMLTITIEDTGCGISAEQQANIFNRFASGKAGGTGLGLSICKELMQQMGGTIRLKSRKGHGTTVWITLPCAAGEIVRS